MQKKTEETELHFTDDMQQAMESGDAPEKTRILKGETKNGKR